MFSYQLIHADRWGNYDGRRTNSEPIYNSWEDAHKAGMRASEKTDGLIITEV